MGEIRDTSQRVMKTRNKIKDVCKELICETGASGKINVTEITKRADIYRKTFYLHYNAIEELFEDLLSDILSKYAKYAESLSTPMTHEEVNRAFFMFCSELEPWEERLICDPMYTDFSNKLFTSGYLRNKDRYNAFAGQTEETQEWIAHFLISSSLELYRHWVATGKKMKLGALMNLSEQLVDRGISSLRTDRKTE